jgi:hypothetical protein
LKQRQSFVTEFVKIENIINEVKTIIKKNSWI